MNTKKRYLRFALLAAAILMVIVVTVTVFKYLYYNKNGNTNLLKYGLPYNFEIPKNTKVSLNKNLSQCINIGYPDDEACIYITYKPVSSLENAYEYINDAKKLVNLHQIKAHSMQEGIIKTYNGYTATIIEIIGESPSTFQFYTTDYTSHFLRGALYFKTLKKVQNKKAGNKIKKDIINMLNTLQWK